MATAYKVLGQVNPSATTATTLYTVPAATSTIVSTLSIANLGVSTTYRVSVRPAGATQADEHYLAYDVALAANDAVMLTLGITLAATDVVTAYAGTADLAFGLFGSELS